MEKNKLKIGFAIVCLMILLAALSRLLPHPANFAPIGGMALFGAAFFHKRYLAFLIPIVSMWISDLILNNVVYGEYFDHFVWFYSGSIFTYGSFALISLMGVYALKKIRIPNVILSALGASVIFFIFSNFGVWFSTTMYPKSIDGLLMCYTAGIPFFKNTVIGDLFYTIVMFGSFELASRSFPIIQYYKRSFTNNLIN